MDIPLVRCSSCEREWHSPTMAEGLRTVGSCPRCNGALEFAPETPETAAEASARRVVPESETAPHLVLGVPRR